MNDPSSCSYSEFLEQFFELLITLEVHRYILQSCCFLHISQSRLYFSCVLSIKLLLKNWLEFCIIMMHSSELFLHANVYLLQTHGISQKKRLALDIYFCKQLRNFCYMMCTYLPPSFCNLREKEMIQIREAGGRKYAYYGGVIWSVSGRPFEAVLCSCFSPVLPDFLCGYTTQRAPWLGRKINCVWSSMH